MADTYTYKVRDRAWKVLQGSIEADSTRQFATMTNSGLSLLRALSILEEQTESKALAAPLREVRIDVEKGSALSQALARHPKAFNRLYIAMVRSGEAGGVLDSVLMRLADTIEKQVEL